MGIYVDEIWCRTNRKGKEFIRCLHSRIVCVYWLCGPLISVVYFTSTHTVIKPPFACNVFVFKMFV